MTDQSHLARDARIDMGAVAMAVLKRLPRIVLVTLVLLAAAYVVLMFTPRMYESTAGILVEPRTSIYTRATNEPAPSLTGGEAGVVSSQIELIRSRDTLIRVIDEAGLRDVPEFTGREGFSPFSILGRLLGRGGNQAATDAVVLSNLLERMSVVQQRDSRVITVSVRARDPELAARIANAVANAHVSRRAELSLSDTAEASGWLREEIERLRVSVAEAERAVADFRVERDLFTGANNTSLLDQQLSTIANQINAAQERRSTATSRAQRIRGLIDQGRAIDGIPDIQQSAVVQQLTQERARLQGERAQLSATLLPNHPNVRAISAQITELEGQIRTEARQIAEALESEADIEANIEASLRAELETLKVSASTATRETVTLQEMTREAAAQRDLLESYLRRYNEAITRTDSNSALPDVRVISLAAPAVNPASPQTSLILLAVALVSVTSQVGIIIFSELISGRALRPVLPAAVPVGAAPYADEPPIAEPVPAATAWQDVHVEPADPLVAAAERPEPVTVEDEDDLAAVAEPVAEPVEDEPVSEDPVAEEPLAAAAEEEDRFTADEREWERRAGEWAETAAADTDTDAEPEWTAEEPALVSGAETEEIDAEEIDAEGIEAEEIEAADEPAVAISEPEWSVEEPSLDGSPGVGEETDAVTLAEPAFAAEASSGADVVDPVPAAAFRADAPLGTDFDDHARLAADLVLGRCRIVLLAGQAGASSCERLADALAREVLDKGMSVVFVDAGSGQAGAEPGIADLTRNEVSFGDVVHKAGSASYARVPWGQGADFDRRSARPATLIEALSDVYEVVIVSTGKIGMSSTLPSFVGTGDRLVLVSETEQEAGRLDALGRELTDAGYGRTEVVRMPERAAA